MSKHRILHDERELPAVDSKLLKAYRVYFHYGSGALDHVVLFAMSSWTLRIPEYISQPHQVVARILT